MMFKKVASACFYAISSIMIIFANKIVLTTYQFSSYQTLALGQLVISLLVINIIKKFKVLKIADFDMKTGWKLMPLSFIYFCNLLFGLGGTQSLSLPMFTVLRRFSVLMTMYGELYILGSKKSATIQISIYMMVFGTIIAAFNDLSFDLYGYVFITLNNIFTAANGIYTKKKFDSSGFGEYDLLYYNATFTIIPMILLSFYSGEFEKLKNFDQWYNAGFWFFFILSSIMAFILNYSWMLCTKYNSPLTTTVIGCLKNILVTYVGMFVGGDYIYSNLNFFGLFISTVASVVYSYLTFSSKRNPLIFTHRLEERTKTNKVIFV